MIHTGKKVTESSWNEVKNLLKLGDVIVCRVPNETSIKGQVKNSFKKMQRLIASNTASEEETTSEYSTSDSDSDSDSDLDLAPGARWLTVAESESVLLQHLRTKL